MRKQFFAFLFFVVSLFGEEIEISAKSFVADEKKRVTEFSGGVVVKKGNDYIKSKKLVVNFSDKNEPSRYEASGGVDFELTFEKDRRYKGSAKSVVYDAIHSQYLLNGDVSVQEIGGDRSMRGEKVVINAKSGQAQVMGDDDKPVIFKFSVKEKK